MKMVSAAKLKRAQDRILAARPYSHQLREVMGNLSERVNRASHPLLQRRDGNTTELLVVTSDRGLCGAFNTNILRQAVEFLEEQTSQGNQVSVSLAGRKSIDFSDDAIGRFVSNGEESLIGSVLNTPWISGKTLCPNIMKVSLINCMWSITNLNRSCSSR